MGLEAKRRQIQDKSKQIKSVDCGITFRSVHIALDLFLCVFQHLALCSIIQVSAELLHTVAKQRHLDWSPPEF